MARTDQGALVVLDRNRHIKVFEPQDTTYTLKSVIPLDYDPDDVCMLNGQIHVAGFRTDEAGTDAMVHVYTLAGEHQRSFGEPYKDVNVRVRSRMSMDASIACSQETQTVQLMFEWVPVIFDYSADGTLAWTRALASFKPMHVSTFISEQGTLGMRHLESEDGTVVPRYISALPQGFVLVQLVDLSRWAHEHTYLISCTDGQGIYLGSKLSRVFASTSGYLLSGDSYPFPQMKLSDTQPLSL